MTQLALRLDSKAEEALARLVERTGQSRSEVVRQAVTAYDRTTLIAQMRQESLLVSADPADTAETASVLEDMRQRRAW